MINRSSSGISGKCNFKYRVKKNTTTTKGIETADNLRHKRFRFTARERTKFRFSFLVADVQSIGRSNVSSEKPYESRKSMQLTEDGQPINWEGLKSDTYREIDQNVKY